MLLCYVCVKLVQQNITELQHYKPLQHHKIVNYRFVTNLSQDRSMFGVLCKFKAIVSN